VGSFTLEESLMVDSHHSAPQGPPRLVVFVLLVVPALLLYSGELWFTRAFGVGCQLALLDLVVNGVGLLRAVLLALAASLGVLTLRRAGARPRTPFWIQVAAMTLLWLLIFPTPCVALLTASLF
jgi:hypothetical protein